MIMCSCGNILNHHGECGSPDLRSYARIRPQIREALDKWAEKGTHTGHFLQAVLENSLFDAIGLADDDNLTALPAIVAYVYNELPSGCWGSVSKIRTWHSDHTGIKS